jgi:hypothetical protein
METMSKTIEVFMSILSTYSGAKPTFQVDFDKQMIIIKDCPSAFVKIVVNYPKAMCHLTSNGLSFQLFVA